MAASNSLSLLTTIQGVIVLGVCNTGTHSSNPQKLWGLVLYTGLSETPLMGHLGCLASRWCVPVSVSLLLLVHQIL